MFAFISFVFRVSLVWVTLNVLTAAAVWYGGMKQHPVKRHPDGEVHTWLVDENEWVFSDMALIICAIVAIWSSVVLTIVAFQLHMREVVMVVDREREPLLKV